MKVWDRKSGLLSTEDIDLIQELVKLVPENEYVTIMDLGAGSGTSALSIAYARPKNIKIISVDISLDALEATKANMIQYGFIDIWQGFKGRSDRAPKALHMQFKSVHMICCDSTHDYASQQDEIEAWLPYLKLNSPVWCHNYLAQQYPGVKTAIDEFVNDGILKTIRTSGLSWGGYICKSGR